MCQHGGSRVRSTTGRDERISVHKGKIGGVGSSVVLKTGASDIMEVNPSQRGSANTKNNCLNRIRNSIPDQLRVQRKAFPAGKWHPRAWSVLLIRYIGLDDISVCVNVINVINGIMNRITMIHQVLHVYQMSSRWCSALLSSRKERGIIGSSSRKNKSGILFIGKSSTTGSLAWADQPA
jgi:hypothetical protein